MNELELKIKIIEAFLENTEYCYGYAYFEDKTGQPRTRIKPIMDELRKADMVAYVRGLMDDDGQVAGSGFELTTRATQVSIREWLEVLKEIRKDSIPPKQNKI